MWLQNQRDLYGDQQPNTKQVHMDQATKKLMHEYYRQDYLVLFGEDDHLDYKAFLNLWQTSFFDLKLRVRKGTSGKCWVCAWINEGSTE